jgi:hypothetical protein
MRFFEDIVAQANKKLQAVCGDYLVTERANTGTISILCDGIGSGIYANVAAITCASRISGMVQGGMSIRAAAETVAASMHRARTEDIPFSAFTISNILPDGKFVVYTYEAPKPILMEDYHATVLAPRFYTAGFEVIGETTGALNEGDSLMIFSDGVSQAGLGHGHGMGIGSDGVRNFINNNHKSADNIYKLPSRILELCKKVSAGNYEDDTTLAMLYCREAKELTLTSGPPYKASLDARFAADFINGGGLKVICGSTTTDVISRELGLEVTMLSKGNSFGQPPEYWMDGADLVAEGAITLNQVCNIIDEPPERLTGNSAAERLCLMLRETDVVHLMVGTAENDAHEDLIFKQIGISVRRATLQRLTAKLKSMGKLVTEKYY